MVKTVEQIKAEYAPYNTMTAFLLGYNDYVNNCRSSIAGINQVAKQAYDRGMEAAMRVARGDK